MYTDDATCMSRTRDGGQKLTTVVSDFALCTGTIIKPEKSYTYATKTIKPLRVRMYMNTKEGFRTYELKQTKQDEYFRHLGNVQNGAGQYHIRDTKMHDGSVCEGVLAKLKKNSRAMRARNITGSAVIQILKIVIYKQIAYPAQFAQYLPKEYAAIQKQVDSIIRRHVRITSRVGSGLIHTHEQIGGMGESRVKDIVNTDRSRSHRKAKTIHMVQCLYGTVLVWHCACMVQCWYGTVHSAGMAQCTVLVWHSAQCLYGTVHSACMAQYTMYGVRKEIRTDAGSASASIMPVHA
jgi:hypothetical protein